MPLGWLPSIDRIVLGLAVTLEFLGPLAVALAATRNRTDLLIATVAAVGVYVLVLPGPASDYLGLGLGLAAGACWAAYIVLNRVVGARLPGLQAPAAASAVSALVYLPVLVVLTADGRLAGMPLLYAVAAGLLSSVVPYAADLTALRFVPTRLFGVFMSTHPVLAAVIRTGSDMAPGRRPCARSTSALHSRPKPPPPGPSGLRRPSRMYRAER